MQHYISEDSYSVLIESKLPSINRASYWLARLATLVAGHNCLFEEFKARHDNPLCRLPRGNLSKLGPRCFIPITVF